MPEEFFEMAAMRTNAYARQASAIYTEKYFKFFAKFVLIINNTLTIIKK